MTRGTWIVGGAGDQPRYARGVRCAIAIAVLVAAPAVGATATMTSSSQPYPGIRHEEWQDQTIPALIHVVRVDLTSAEIQLVATPEASRGKTTTAAATALGAVVAINGDYFAVGGFQPAGLAMGDGAVWAGTADDGVSGFLAFARVGERSTASISPPPAAIAAGDLDPAAQGVIGGRPLLLSAGQPPTTFACGDGAAEPCVRSPRTAVGLSADGNTMWLVVVDGWQDGSLGMTAAELATFMKQIGASDALATDGGSASSMVLGGAEIASPSDGVERAVANQLAVRYGSLPSGQLVGFIRERDVFGGKDLVGAVATLDDGRQQTVGTGAMYDFSGVTPRYACVTASLAGYHPSKRCVQVLSQQMNYDSIALYPNGDFIDANPGDPDAGENSDARRVVDAGPGDDGGFGAQDGRGGGGSGTGCCSAGGGPFPSAPALALALGLVVRWRRRKSR